MKKRDIKQTLKNIEKNIRSEQGFASSIGKYLPFKKSQSYKKLTKKQQRDFNQSLKEKHTTIKIHTLVLTLCLALLSFVFLKIEFTGRAIENIVGNQAFNIISYLILFILALLIILIIYKKFNKR